MTSSQIWSILLPLVVTLILAKSSTAKAVPIGQNTESSPPLEPQKLEEQQQKQRNDCKLTFDAMTMDSLVQPNTECTGLPIEKKESKRQAVGDGKGDGQTVANKLEEEPKAELEPEQRHFMSSMDSQPIYELQLVVWPSDDIEDGDDFNPLTATITTTATTATTTTMRTPSTATASASSDSAVFPLYEDQLVVFPQMDFEEENLDYIFDESPVPATILPPPPPPPISTTTSTSTSASPPTSTSRPWPTASSIYVVQDYRVIHPNGTEEYKLVLSNGLVNYKKIYSKVGVNGQHINVQEGYYRVPIPGRKNQFQTYYYIADERGNNVYKIEQSHQVPEQSKPLHYKATKLP